MAFTIVVDGLTVEVVWITGRLISDCRHVDVSGAVEVVGAYSTEEVVEVAGRLELVYLTWAKDVECDVAYGVCDVNDSGRVDTECALGHEPGAFGGSEDGWVAMSDVV